MEQMTVPVLFALVAQVGMTTGHHPSLIAPLACQLEKHDEQIDEVEIERQSPEYRLFSRHIAGITRPSIPA
jgi:hypothetical protein